MKTEKKIGRYKKYFEKKKKKIYIFFFYKSLIFIWHMCKNNFEKFFSHKGNAIKMLIFAVKKVKMHILKNGLRQIGCFLWWPVLTSSCGRNFVDIDFRFFANCRRRIIVFFLYATCRHLFIFFFLKMKIWQTSNVTEKNALQCKCWQCFLLTTRL